MRWFDFLLFDDEGGADLRIGGDGRGFYKMGSFVDSFCGRIKLLRILDKYKNYIKACV